MLIVLHMDATLDSDSFLLFSRLKPPPKPNFLRSEDVFELNDPVLKDRDLVKELVAEPELAGLSIASSKR